MPRSTVRSRESVFYVVAATFVVAVWVATSRLSVRPLARIQLYGANQHAWIDPDRVLIISKNCQTFRIISLDGRERSGQLPESISIHFRRGGSLTASPGARFVGWHDWTRTYSTTLADLTSAKTVRCANHENLPLWGSYWIDAERYATTFIKDPGLEVSIVNARTGQRRVVRVHPPRSSNLTAVRSAVYIVGQTRDHRLVLCEYPNTPSPSELPLYVVRADLPSTVAAPVSAQIPFGADVPNPDWLSMTPDGKELVWLVPRNEARSYVARLVDWIGAGSKTESYTLCSTELNGGSARTIAEIQTKLSEDGSPPFMGSVRVSPDGRRISFAIGDELLVYAK